MVAINNLFPLKALLVTLVTLTLLLAVQGYLGPRYGKREPDGSLRNYGGRVGVVGRSGGPRNIQSRSQTRFYAGSRYGGKRSDWQAPVLPDVEMPSPNVPYDCVYLPYLGLRCAARPEESGWTNENEDDPMSIVNSPAASAGTGADQ